MQLHYLVTGGTFDKEYNELDGNLFFKETHLQEMLALGRSRVDAEISTLFLMDSLKMDDTHRNRIAQACETVSESRIVVTHGTDTIVETATIIAGRVKNKTIVLTGAMIPWKFGSSDGMFNLGSATAFAQVLPVGVYISMNGQLFSWDKVRKNREKGEFEVL